jgi:predicted DsbA family dithiol-disulfide isomerase
LHPETPLEGRALTDLFGVRNPDREARQARMAGLMAEEGLPYGERTHTYNSRLAQEVGKWADAEGHGDAFHEAMFHAYFVAGRNIADVETLAQIAESVGLSADAARAVMAERRFQAAVDADWQRSRDYGITGVPTFVANERGVVGAQPYEILERLVVTAGGTPRQQG